MISATATRTMPRIQNEQPAPPPPQNPVQESYIQTDALILGLKQAAEAEQEGLADQLRTASSEVKTAFKTEVLENTTEVPKTVEQAKAAVLGALQYGLVAGALDGALVFALDQLPLAPGQEGTIELQGDLSGIEFPDFDEIMERLGQLFEDAKEALKNFGVEALHVVAGEAKNAGHLLHDEAGQLLEVEELPVEAYQAYLTAAFATGYAVAGLDSALIIEANETPRN